MKKTVKRTIGFVALVLFILMSITVIILPEKKKQINTQHFTFNFSNSIDTQKINVLAGLLEDNYSRISQDLKAIPTKNVQVNIYAKRWRYIKATWHWTGSGNAEGASKLHFVVQAWADSNSKKVVVHEYTHTVVFKLLIDREPLPLDTKKLDEKLSKFPVWLWEATGVYEANQFHDPKTMQFFANGSYPTLSELNDRSKGRKIYSVGFTIIEYILHKYGQDKFIELLASYGNLQKVLNVTDEEFNKGWYDFVKEKYLK